MRRLFRAILVPAILLLFWEWLGRSGRVSPAILPAPSQVFSRWLLYLCPEAPFAAAGPGVLRKLSWLVSGELPHDAFASLSRIAVGFSIGTALALPLGLWMGARPLAYQYLNPLFQLIRPIPPIAFIPLSILWFGLGNPPAFFLIALGAFFPVLLNTIAGVRSVEEVHLRAALNLGASQASLFRRVIFPAALPQILTGVRVGIGVAFIVVIVAEMIAVNSGLGYRILEAREFFWSDKIIAGMITIGSLGLAIDSGMALLNRRLLRWQREPGHA